MKLLILSDIHSNPACLEAILKAESDADAIYCAGDLVDYGPDPASVIDLVRKNNIHTVCGNHDRRVVRLWTQWDRTLPETGLRWAHHNIQKLETAFSQSTQQPAATEKTALGKTGSAENVIGQENPYYQYLKSLPRFLSFTADGIAYLMTHQYGDEYETIESSWHFNQFWNEHFDPVECGLVPENRILPEYSNMPRRMIFGHTHRQMQVTFADQQSDTVFAGRQSVANFADKQSDTAFAGRQSVVNFADKQSAAVFADRQSVANFVGQQSDTAFAGRQSVVNFADKQSAAVLAAHQCAAVLANPQAVTGADATPLWLNPGSASYRRPDEPSKDAFYAVIADGNIQMKRLPYDRSPIYKQVLALQDKLDPDELRVAQFFFGRTEADGPDYPWISYIKNKELKAKIQSRE